MNISVFDNIVLQPLERNDARDIFHAIDTQRDYLGRWLPFVAATTGIEFTQEFVNSVITAPEGQFEPTFSIRKSGAFAGLIGFRCTDKSNRKTEIGYWLSQSYQGNGMMTRCVNKLCQHAFDRLAMNRIQIKCAVGNRASAAIPQRLGFTFEGIERSGELFPDGNFADIEVYSLLKSEFKP